VGYSKQKAKQLSAQFHAMAEYHKYQSIPIFEPVSLILGGFIWKRSSQNRKLNVEG